MNEINKTENLTEKVVEKQAESKEHKNKTPNSKEGKGKTFADKPGRATSPFAAVKGSKGGLKLRFQAYESQVLGYVVKTISEIVRNSGGQIRSIVQLPTKKQLITVNKAPHIDKRSRDQFIYRVHTVVVCLNANEQIRDVLVRTSIPANVHVSLRSF